MVNIHLDFSDNSASPDSVIIAAYAQDGTPIAHVTLFDSGEIRFTLETDALNELPVVNAVDLAARMLTKLNDSFTEDHSTYDEIFADGPITLEL